MAAVSLVRLPVAINLIAAPAKVLVRLLLKVIPPPYTLIGPAILTALLSVMPVALVVLPIVNPVTPASIVKVDGKVCAEPKLALLSNE